MAGRYTGDELFVGNRPLLSSFATFNQLHSEGGLEPAAVADLLIEICNSTFLVTG